MWAFIDLVVDEGDEIPDGKRKLLAMKIIKFTWKKKTWCVAENVPKRVGPRGIQNPKRKVVMWYMLQGGPRGE